ncbi:MAG: hypothetical protein ABJ215_14895 [Alphaproteobacteria bacterium]
MNDETSGDADKAATKKSNQTESERAREARQAAALRENLRKRNAQRRERKSPAPDSGTAVDGD